MSPLSEPGYSGSKVLRWGTIAYSQTETLKRVEKKMQTDLVTFNSFIKVISVFINDTEVVACFCTMRIEV